MKLIEEAQLLIEMPAPAEAKEIREAARISVARLAQEVGVTRFTLHSWEAGTSQPKAETRLRYAQILRDLRALTEAA